MKWSSGALKEVYLLSVLLHQRTDLYLYLLYFHNIILREMLDIKMLSLLRSLMIVVVQNNGNIGYILYAMTGRAISTLKTIKGPILWKIRFQLFLYYKAGLGSI